MTGWLMADRPVEGGLLFLLADEANQPQARRISAMASKAEEIYDKAHKLMDEGVSRTEAFKKIAQETGLKYDSVRGSFYSHKLKAEGGGSPNSRTRRRETTPEDALADARAALERAVDSIDREVENAEERATEATAEAKSLKASAADRKKAITERLEALK